MQETFERFLTDLTADPQPSALKAATLRAMADFGISAVAYLCSVPKGDRRPVLLSSYPRAWTDHYVASRYDRIDPVIRTASSHLLPFFWGTPEMERRMDRQQRQLFDEAAMFGIRHGFTIPIHDSGGFSASFNLACSSDLRDFTRRIDAHKHVIHLIGIYLHAHMRQALLSPASEAVHLSPREVTCLNWYARGKSQWEIAQILGISQRTVRFHIENAAKKFGVTTARQAVLRAAEHGYIT